MTAVKPAGLETFLRRPDPSVGAVLIYGEEPDAVRELAAKVVKRIAGSLDDPFAVMVLQDGDLSQDPARLVDEVQSQSLFGGAKAIWIKGAEQSFLKAAEPVLAGKVSGNFIVAEASGLAKSSALRQAFEKSAHALIVPLYEAEPGEIEALLENLLGRDKMKIDSGAVSRFIELAGTNRGLARSEAEKLALYCLGQAQVSAADVEAVCGNDIGADPTDLVDAVFLGEIEDVDRVFHTLVQSGTDPGRLASVGHLHAMRLEDFRIAIEKGMAVEQVMRSARPPIFFKRQNSIRLQLKIWTLAELTTAARTLAEAVSTARSNASLAMAISGRALLSVARQARKSRHEL